MNWIKTEEQIRIKEAADTLAQSGRQIPRPSKVFQPILEYALDSPMELQSALEDMWDELGKPEMKKFSIPVVVAAFKNRDETEEIELSPFNYQF